MNREFDIPRLELVKDIFLFACFTGLAFADVSTLRPEHLEQDNNGDWWIRKGRVKLERRRKSSSIANVPLLPVPLAILKKYESHYLKEIADFCGIKKNLTTHLARHSKLSFLLIFNSLQNILA